MPDEFHQSPASSLALAEPTTPVSSFWIASNTLANLGICMAALTPPEFLLATQSQQVAPGHRYLLLGIANMVGSIGAITCAPIVGLLSDRTSMGSIPLFGPSHGRRHPWTLTTAILGAASLTLLAFQHSVLGIVVLWLAFSICQAAMFATLSASVPDHVPVYQRATVTGWLGMPQALGIVIGAVIVSKFAPGLFAGYLTLALVLLLFTLPFVLLTSDQPLESRYRQPLNLREFREAFMFRWRDYPDFAWAWLTRLLVMIANATGTLYLLYFVEGPIDHDRGGRSLAYDRLLVLILIYSAGAVLSAVLGGIISDHLKARKPVVFTASVIMTAAASILVFWETWLSVIIAATMLGIGFGAYTAANQALVTQVLPAAAHRGRDLGFLSIANNASQSIGAALAVPIVAIGSYPALYLFTAAMAALGAALIYKIRGVA